MTEMWRAIPGYEGRYEVSDEGRVRSLTRIIRITYPNGRTVDRSWRGRILKNTPVPAGYLYTSLGGRNGKSVYMTVHCAVARAFLGPCPEGMEVCHNNGDKADNRASNLRYGTGKENAADSILHGTRPRGERNGQSRLTEADVRWLRENPACLSIQALAAKLNVHPDTVRLAAARKTWAHVDAEAA